MTQFRKILLAGTASFALVATPVVAADVLGGATGAASGTASGAVDATGSAAGNTIGGSAETAGDAEVGAGMAQMDTGGSIDVDTPTPPASGVENAPTAPAAPGAADVDPTSKLTEMGYTDIAPAEGSVTSGGEASYTATNAEGQRVNVVVDGRTGAVVSEQPADETQDSME
ncbi:MAG: hypothetical protein AMXMBFR74_12670 [Parvibaculum sp.]|uniref:hypothetical protein n=1 Tax=Parvibaculum sp. TaxID=2024848 RepID=UPI0035B6C29C